MYVAGEEVLNGAKKSIGSNVGAPPLRLGLKGQEKDQVYKSNKNTKRKKIKRQTRCRKNK
jgi:hypothetical protein